MTRPKIDWQLLDQYLKGQVSLHERYAVDQWLEEAGSEEIRDFFKELGDDGELRQAQAEFRSRLERGELTALDAGRRVTPRQTSRTVPHRRRSIWKIAAAVVLVLSGSVAIWRGARLVVGRRADAALGMIAAPVGRPPVPAWLPDGSRVILSPGSTLRYATTFGTDRREVHLDGEAYFTVRHETGRPFLVRAGDLVAEDLGTEFVVRAYPEDSYGRVVVRSGVVGISGAKITPGQLGRLDANGAPIVESADTTSWFGWTRGELNLRGMRLGDALPKLNRWYGLEFRLADPSLGNVTLGGKLPDRLDDAELQRIATVLRLSVTREGRVVTFRALSPSQFR